VTPHFTLAELTVTDHRSLDNTPDPAALANLHRLAEFLEQVREVLGGRPVMVNSAFRSAEINAACGGRKTSQHLVGCAADIRVPGMAPDAVVRAVMASGLAYDQLIRELTWTHISIPSVPAAPPRRMALIIDRQGARAFV